MPLELPEVEAKVRLALTEIDHPQYRRSLMDIGMMGPVQVQGEDVLLTIKTPDQVKELQVELEARVRRKLKDVPPDGKLKISFVYDEQLSQEVMRRRLEKVKNVIAVGSGKGGVGKSTVSANIAAALHTRGYKVGILDSDVYGPSVGKMFGFPGAVELKLIRKSIIVPLEAHGIRLMSFSFIVHPGEALVWRGPILNNAIEQLLFEVDWGELDYLIVDLPPGTGDVQITLAQSVSIDGAVIVSTPQSVAIQDAHRAATMFQQVSVPILGIVENMSEYICPHCGGISHIFSREGTRSLEEEFQIPHLGSIPLQTEIMQSGESGKPIVLADPDGPVSQAYKKIADALVEQAKKFKVD